MTEEEITTGAGASTPTGNHNTHSFLHAIAIADDTTRLSNLTAEELGKADNPVRAFKALALFAGEIMKKEGLKKYFDSRSEIVTSSALSKEGFLPKLGVIQRRELADVSPKEKKENKSWFKKKNKDSEALTE